MTTCRPAQTRCRAGRTRVLPTSEPHPGCGSGRLRQPWARARSVVRPRRRPGHRLGVGLRRRRGGPVVRAGSSGPGTGSAGDHPVRRICRAEPLGSDRTDRRRLRDRGRSSGRPTAAAERAARHHPVDSADRGEHDRGGRGVAATLASFTVAGVNPQRWLAVPESGTVADVLSFTAATGQRTGCTETGATAVCRSSLARAGEEDDGICRRFVQPAAASYRVSATVTLRPGAALNPSGRGLSGAGECVLQRGLGAAAATRSGGRRVVLDHLVGSARRPDSDADVATAPASPAHRSGGADITVSTGVDADPVPGTDRNRAWTLRPTADGTLSFPEPVRAGSLTLQSCSPPSRRTPIRSPRTPNCCRWASPRSSWPVPICRHLPPSLSFLRAWTGADPGRSPVRDRRAGIAGDGALRCRAAGKAVCWLDADAVGQPARVLLHLLGNDAGSAVVLVRGAGLGSVAGETAWLTIPARGAGPSVGE